MGFLEHTYVYPLPYKLPFAPLTYLPPPAYPSPYISRLEIFLCGLFCLTAAAAAALGAWGRCCCGGSWLCPLPQGAAASPGAGRSQPQGTGTQQGADNYEEKEELGSNSPVRSL